MKYRDKSGRPPGRPPYNFYSFMQIAAILFALIALFATIYYLQESEPATPDMTDSVKKLEVLVEEIDKNLMILRGEIDPIKIQVSEMQKFTEQNKITVSLNELKGRLSAVDKRLESLESIIKEDPRKALSLVLLAKDLEHLRSSVRTELGSLRNEFKMFHEFNKIYWILFGTLAISLLCVAVGNLFRSNRTNDSGSTGVTHPAIQENDNAS